MLKEIFEQPQTVRNAIRGRMDYEEATAKFGGLNMTVAELRAVDKIVITAGVPMGTPGSTNVLRIELIP